MSMEQLEKMVQRVKASELRPIIERLNSIDESLAEIKIAIGRKRKGNLITTREAAAIFGMRDRAWREKYVPLHIQPAGEHRSLFERQKVMRLYARVTSQPQRRSA
jgi:hypothetical protein